MCKLCNTNKNSAKIRIKYDKSIINFIATVYLYTDQIPCRDCIDAYKCIINKHPTINIDDWIINRLTKSYFSTKLLNYWRQKKSGNMQKCVTIECNITKVYRHEDALTFAFTSKRNKTKVYKTFHTLEEAQQFKRSYNETLNTNT